jgi:hypothetical protein
MLSDEAFRVRDIGLGKCVAQQASSLTMLLLVAEAEDSSRRNRHAVVDRSFHESGLLAMDFLDDALKMPSAKTSSSKQSSASPRSRHPSNWTTRHDAFVREKARHGEDAEDNATVRCASVVKRMTGANAAECYHLSYGTQESINDATIPRPYSTKDP